MTQSKIEKVLKEAKFDVSMHYTMQNKYCGEISYKWGVRSSVFVGFVKDDETIVICYGDNISKTTSLRTEKVIELREILEENKIQYTEEPSREIVAENMISIAESYKKRYERARSLAVRVLGN